MFQELLFFQNDWMNGICLFMKTETFREVGMFDEKFYMNPCSVITHLWGGSSENSLSRSLQHDSFQLYFYSKHFGKKGAVLSRIFRVCRSGLRLMLHFLCFKKFLILEIIFLCSKKIKAG
jgi:GT2 family glycosyltransferase